MMLEGDKDRDGRFPPSPATAPEDGPAGLEAALAAAGVEKMLSEVPAVSASPVVELTPGMQTEAEEPDAEQEPEPEALPEEEPEQEPPSPTSDEELAPPAGTAMPVISPSSSTAPQSETPIHLDVEQGREETQVPVPVPTISVVPATPPAVDEVEDKVEVAVVEEASKEESAVEEEAVPPTVSEAAPADAAEPKKDVVQEEATAPAVETPSPVVPAEPVPAPTVDEEVDVTDTQKDAEVAVADAPQSAEEAPKMEKTEELDSDTL
jgi:hypothetical protein